MCENSRMPRFLYTLLLYGLLPFAPIKLLWRGLRRQPEYLKHWGERFGFYRGSPAQPVIWLHCVSVGETRAAEPLVMALQARYPRHRILFTHTTPTGRVTSEQLFGDKVDRVYMPYDTPGAVARFLRHFKPDIGLILETELWFNLISACHARQIPLLLVNARMSAKSAHGYGKVARLTEQGLTRLSAIAAQTEQDKQRLQSLGAQNVTICGNLKFDVEPPADADALGAALRERIGELVGRNRPVFLAASTREGEEEQILDAIRAADVPQLLTILVPRHPQRFAEVAQLLKKRGFACLQRSRLAHISWEDVEATNVEVILGDSMGEMFTYYAACDLAFIGGSLLPYGGQNLIEACAMGKPVLVGPHTFNFEAAAEFAIADRAAWRVRDSGELAKAMQRLFGDAEARQAMGWAAIEFSRSAGGAVHKVCDLVARFLPPQNH